MKTICPNCGNHDTIYMRAGGALVCRACFVTETVLGSWSALPDLRGPSADLPTCPEIDRFEARPYAEKKQ